MASNQDGELHIVDNLQTLDKPITCLGLCLGWQSCYICLNLVKMHTCHEHRTKLTYYGTHTPLKEMTLLRCVHHSLNCFVQYAFSCNTYHENRLKITNLMFNYLLPFQSSSRTRHLPRQPLLMSKIHPYHRQGLEEMRRSVCQ